MADVLSVNVTTGERTERAFTVAERTDRDAKAAAWAAKATVDATATTNAGTLRSRAQAAIAANDTYLALGSPSAAQNTAQIRTLTKECTALIRLALGLLDSTAGT